MMARRLPPPNDRISLTLRLDGDIHEALKLISAMEMRSLNTQIEYFLRKCILGYDAEVEYFDDALETAIQRIRSRMAEPRSSDTPD